jgi:acyl-[acyl-carrier-protein]-phospholipid O-acyltransferase/long-chain-fatty-acid--[acyl-carrier-protein] ligase
VIAVTDRQRGETLVLFTTDTQLERSALLAAARQQGLAELLIPKRLERVERLPLLGTGKTDYVRLAKMTTETAE